VTHGLKAPRSTCFYLRKCTGFEFCDTSATRMRRDNPVTAVEAVDAIDALADFPTSIPRLRELCSMVRAPRLADTAESDVTRH
jgi:hypothetical protein